MAERKAVNKYYPPDWDPAKQGSVNKRVGQHPLRDRARKLNQGILVIRFELPYNIWCDGCNNHVGMGVRYNAEKKKVGNYYSTPIYKFRMKCHLCDSHFEIQTDPKNHDYVVVTGARRKEQRWDPRENEQIVTDDKAMQKKLAMDAMFKLEHGTDDKQKSKTAASTLARCQNSRDQWKDDYILNKQARQKFRGEKKSLNAEKEADKDLLQRSSLDIPLVPEAEEDIQLAGLLKYKTIHSFDEKQQEKRKEIDHRPLFAHSSPCAGPASINNISKTNKNQNKTRLSFALSSTSPFSNNFKSSVKAPHSLLGIVKKGVIPSSKVTTNSSADFQTKTHALSTLVSQYNGTDDSASD